MPGADINLTDPYGVTPLIVATLNLQNDFAAYLVEKGADINQWDLYGRTPLYVAIDMMDYPPPRHPGLGRADVGAGSSPSSFSSAVPTRTAN